MEINANFELAKRFVNQTGKNIFVTGKAGTGKTTFLKNIVENTFKKTVVAAPTGIAAINAGGVTLHSLLQLPMLPYLPTNQFYDQNVAFTKRTFFMQQRMGRDKIKLLNELELLIIDEASMLRADTLDCIDEILKVRRRSNEAFGGLQVLFIGDLYQLPPVVRREEEALLREYYDGFYFFNAQVLKDDMPICIELDKVYRQQDDFFINILNEVRDGKLKPDHLDVLNDRYFPNFEPDRVGDYITVCSHNHKADEINQSNLLRLKSNELNFEAEVTGEFYAEPVDKVLRLKEGAQVIFIRNDKGEPRRYFNGKIGIIDKILEKSISIKFPMEGNSITIEKDVWENKRVEFNTETDEIEEKILGTFVQFPIKLAWAITIHKSQGLTFDRAVVDAGDSFAPGQVYVALSRLRTLDGMILKSKITDESVKTDPLVKAFAKKFEKNDQLLFLLEESTKEYLPKLLYRVFDFYKLAETFEFHMGNLSKRKFDGLPEAQTLADQMYYKIKKQSEVASKFVMQLEGIVNQIENDYTLLNERVGKAVEYFNSFLGDILVDLQQHRLKYVVKKNTKSYVKDVDLLLLVLRKFKDQLNKSELLTKAIAGDLSFFDTFSKKENKENDKNLDPGLTKTKKGEKEVKEKVDTKKISFDLFKEHNDIPKVAELRGLVVSTVLGHLTQYVRTGEIEVGALIQRERLEFILTIMDKLPKESSSKQVKDTLGDEYSYGDIAVAQAYLAFVEGNHNDKKEDIESN